MTQQEQQPRQIRLFDARWRFVYYPDQAVMPQMQAAHRELLNHVLFFNTGFQELYNTGVIHGYVPDRSAITHAKTHKGAGAILTLDLFKAFESIDKSRVVNALLDARVAGELLDFLAQHAFVRHSGKEILAPGFPTSQDLFNLVLLPMDAELVQYVKDNGLCYSRYADDLAFSTPREISFLPQTVVDEIRAIVGKHGHDAHKIRVGKPWNAAVKICGVSVVGNRITLPSETLEEIRQQIEGCLGQEPRNWQRALGLLTHIKNVRPLPQRMQRYEALINELRKEAKREHRARKRFGAI